MSSEIMPRKTWAIVNSRRAPSKLSSYSKWWLEANQDRTGLNLRSFAGIRLYYYEYPCGIIGWRCWRQHLARSNGCLAGQNVARITSTRVRAACRLSPQLLSFTITGWLVAALVIWNFNPKPNALHSVNESSLNWMSAVVLPLRNKSDGYDQCGDVMQSHRRNCYDH